jgi:SAM-dependent methyltransferase
MTPPPPNAGLETYGQPAAHQAIAGIIRRYSSNTADIREVALGGLDLTAVERALDLGCGFGFMAEMLAPRLAPGASLTGVDACETNSVPFLERLRRAGRQGRFVTAMIGEALPWTAGAFDLIVASYSLYFFPRIVPELARLLAPDGWLLAVTHCRNSFTGLLHAAGLDPQCSPLKELVDRFPAEEADVRLRPHFATVRRIDYPNRLTFRAGDRGDLDAYVRFKLPLLFPGSNPGGKIPAALEQSLTAWLEQRGAVIIEKDDACFQCRGPQCH